MKNEISTYRYKTLIISLLAFRFIIASFIMYYFYDFLESRKFFTDSKTIYFKYVFLNNGLSDIELFNGFNNISVLYKSLSLGHILEFNNLIILSSIIYYIIFTYMILKLNVKANHKVLFLFLIFFYFDVIFLFQPCKDCLALLINVLILYTIVRHKNLLKTNIKIIILMTICALILRQYYFLILGLFIIQNIYAYSKKTYKITIVISISIVFVYLFYKTDLLDEIIFLRNYFGGLKDIGTNTLIENIIPYYDKDILKFILNTIINSIRIAFPFETLKKSFISGIMFLPIQLTFVYLFWTRARILKKLKEFKKTDINKTLINNEDKKIYYILTFIKSFFLISILFEPDFGSVFRHNMALMPYMLYLMFCIDLKTLKEKYYRPIKEENNDRNKYNNTLLQSARNDIKSVKFSN